jgi:DNA helicase-2/ATP-dependent DNA helicase PcrA
LKRLFRAYAEYKSAANLLDYDDLLLFWHAALSEPAVAARMRQRFDCVLVDEYQDTNSLQSEIVRLRPMAPASRSLETTRSRSTVGAA